MTKTDVRGFISGCQRATTAMVVLDLVLQARRDRRQTVEVIARHMQWTIADSRSNRKTHAMDCWTTDIAFYSCTKVIYLQDH